MGAGVRDAFPPPIVVCGDLFTRFVWVDDIVWEDYAQTVDFVCVGLRVDGYFVRVGLRGKI